MNQLLADNKRLRLANGIEAVRVCTAYDLAGKPPVATVATVATVTQRVPAVEVAQASWLAAAQDYEQRHGVRLVKFFTGGDDE